MPASDAHVHFFSRPFFAALARQRNVGVEALEGLLDWRIPADDPGLLAGEWIAELDRHGLDRAALIASIPGDEQSVMAAVSRFPNRFYAYAMVDPTSEEMAGRVIDALPAGLLRGLCFFPAMHRYSMHDARVARLLDAASSHSAVVFVHCGVLSVGVRKKLNLPSAFDMRYSNPIDLHAIALRYPRLRFVVPHFGAGYFREALMLCDLCPNVYLDTSSSNSWMRFEHLDLRTVFRRALDVAGPGRLLFGTDSSFFPRGWHDAVFQAQTKALYELGIEKETALRILHDNLDELFLRESPAQKD
jgi:predicted TIM-barrel fold metal-dependent hydrolase